MRILKVMMIAVLVTVLLPQTLFAWSLHGEMTRVVLDSLPWIDRYNNITITEYSYNDSSPYNSKYKITYLDGNIGDKTSAKKILSLYADEPDWGMDDGLSLSSSQALTGGSQGWRHQYFLLFGGILRLGDAPGRALHFYNMAVVAFKVKDFYWGFRFLARALHYLQDLTMPFHTNPGPTMLLISNLFDINGLTSMVSNHHFALEDYQEYKIKKRDLLYIRSLRDTDPIKVSDVWEAGFEVANRSKNYSESLWNLQCKIFGDNLSSKTRVQIHPEKVSSGALKNEYDKIIIGSLIDFSAITKGFLRYARELFRNIN